MPHLMPTPTTHPAALIRPWVRLWNGEYDHAAAIISPDFRLHAAMLGGASDVELRGGEILVAWITATRTAVEDLTFAVEVGPLVDGDRMALRWRATGHYSGGFPGATAAPGTAVDFTGTDLLRIVDGQIAEYWVNSDMHVLLAQLAVHSGVSTAA